MTYNTKEGRPWSVDFEQEVEIVTEDTGQIWLTENDLIEMLAAVRNANT